MAEKPIFFHATTREIQCPSGGLDYLSLSPGDTLYVTNSEKNDGAYTVTRATDTQIFVKEEIRDELNTAAVLTKPTTPGIPFKVFPVPEREPEPRPAPPPEEPPPKEPPPGKLTPFIGSPFFVKQMETLGLGETAFSRWTAEKAKLAAQTAKYFEAEIKYVEDRIKELGWDDPEAIKKVKKEIEPKKPPLPTPPIQPKVKPELLIERIPYPKWWRDSLNAKIQLTAPGSQVLATVTGKLRLHVSVIVITVTGETVITFTFGNAGSSGPIYLGGENQPMGMVVAMGNSPAPCGNGSLSISATDPGDANPSVGGWATCFAVEEKIMEK